jgi:hypothetical protein
MLQTIAGHLELTVDQVLEMARSAEKAGLVTLRSIHSVALTGEGQDRCTTLTRSANKRARATRRPA